MRWVNGIGISKEADMTKYAGALAVVGWAVLSPIASGAELTVYTALPVDQLPVYQKSFETANPGTTIHWVRDSTNAIMAKLLAEKDNPKADIVLATAASSLLGLKPEGMFEPYMPKGAETLDKRFVDKDQPPQWIGTSARAAAICINTLEAVKRRLPIPYSWTDLIKPVYKGLIVMPDPSSSSAGFLEVSSWLQMMGEEKGWAFMDALHQNIGSYTKSDSKPCTMAASGEYMIGMSFDVFTAHLISDGAPLAYFMPWEGIGWDMDASAIIKGTDEPDAAKKLLDWAVSDEAMGIYSSSYAILGKREAEKRVPKIPAELHRKMIKNDFEWAANNRDRILEIWRTRYESKSESK
jgi:iron(III) transport system substrate-binding protein